MDSLKTPPRTTMDVFKMLPEGTLAEIIDGIIFMSPTPTKKHQNIVLELAISISGFIKENLKGAELVIAPFDVFLDEHANAVQPDIIFILEKNRLIAQSDAVHGVPDLLIEVLSPSNDKHDRVRKKRLYETFGVTEYWIISPDTNVAIGFSLQDGKYTEIGAFEGSIHSKLLGRSFSFIWNR